MQILITGFDRFGPHALNPSELVVRALPAAAHVTTEVLPTDYRLAGERIAALIERLRPDAVLSTGLAAKREVMSLERIALNLDDGPLADNGGAEPRGERIDPEGPLARQSTADLAALFRRLRAAETASEISNHAGAYVCNHVYYCALGAIARLSLSTRCVFLHMPMLSEGNWSLQRLGGAVAAVRDGLIEQAAAATPPRRAARG